jgi:hypothetical protein
VKATVFGSLLFKLFVVASLADLALTTWLLNVHADSVVESNPVANWWLDNYGFAGMAFFKAFTVVVVGLACHVLARSRPRLSKGVLSFACLTVLAVVGYSVYLLNGVRHEANELDMIAEKSNELDIRLEESREYNNLVVNLLRKLKDNQITLKQVVHQLAQTRHAKNPVWAEQMKMYHSTNSLVVSLARNVLKHFQNDETGTTAGVLERLEKEFMTEFAELVEVSTPEAAEPSL